MPEAKFTDIVTELNSHYQTYSEMCTKQQQIQSNAMTYPKSIESAQTDTLIYASSNDHSRLKQIHVFITGLNTCPTYCHVCQQIM